MFSYIITKQLDNKKIVYKKSEYSIDTVPIVNSDIYILVDDLQIGFDLTTGYFTQIFGYFPQLLFCDKKDFVIPQSQKGILTLDIKEFEISSGESIRLKSSKEWITFYSERTDYLYFGKESLSKRVTYIEFCPNCIASVNENGELEGLWLLIHWL
ncbi:hypothetical protein [Streptococcus acidominimus]|uniref:Uncharacterized protein n=1 Tax=Streptococcus acidominimus TaxID=1326 RepID=A0A1Q8EEJ2_STRAI|nr:hypothetical protein [Streptococcus acidominimus]OLF50217.1 hypothetical protein BU200_02905 [Streptococcus acidominimus]SUN06679.1 Uncharacterised protein [Streptococcus acidominimus]